MLTRVPYLLRFTKTRSPIRFASSLCYDSGSNSNDHKEKARKTIPNTIVVGTALTSWIFYKLYEKSKYVQLKEASSPTPNGDAGAYNANLPYYTMDQVSNHANKEQKVWVTFKRGVYDITEFVAQHPGGDQILLAAGSSVEPFWLLYGVHNDKNVLEILETMRIGNLTEETKIGTNDNLDPYMNDPRRHGALAVKSQKPFNAELPNSLLTEKFYTPNELFYVRNHLPVPEVDLSSYELEIEVEGRKKRTVLTWEKLRKYPKHTITVTIACAGNRRAEMSQVKQARGLEWGQGAIGNAAWSGVRLRDILKDMGITEDSQGFEHVQGLDLDTVGNPYSVSIPFWKAVDKKSEVILAYEMNDVPLPRDHGYPIRVIVPGVAGVRNVKWLGRIVVSTKESDTIWQRRDYKTFSSSIDWDTVDYESATPIYDVPVTSAICKPAPSQTVDVSDDGSISVQGYAWSGGGQKIIRVEVTVDGGQTWHPAEFDCQDESSPPQHWAWTLWSASIPVPKDCKKVEIWARAVDSGHNTQPEGFKDIWNFRGLLANAYHKVPIELKT